MSETTRVRVEAIGGGSRRMTARQLRALGESIKGRREMELDESKLWARFWFQKRVDALGIKHHDGETWAKRREIQREAIAWFRDGDAVDFLLWLGCDPDRARELVEVEMAAINGNGRRNARRAKG